MRIQCNSCESAAATVLCCADEAALCSICDQKVHAANKLAGKHQRVRLVAGEGSGSSGRVPKCDICQESSGYFFCLEDRALLCRNCDVAIHSVNSYVAAHQRFLLTGVQVGLEASEAAGPAATQQPNAVLSSKPLKTEPVPKSSPPLPRINATLNRSSHSSLTTENSTILPNQIVRDGGLVADRLPFTGFNFSSSMPDWPLDEFFKFPDFSQNTGFMDQGSSKADSGKFGSSEGSPFNHSANEELGVDECSDPNSPRMVPEIPSPPTFSGLHWQKNRHYPSSDHADHVPDICSSQDPYRRPSTSRSKQSRLQ